MSRFQSGQEKPENSGRKKGSPNRKTLILSDVLESQGHNLPTKILELLPRLSPDRQMDVYLELLQYVYPKRRPMEQTADEVKTAQSVVVYLPDNGRAANSKC